MKTIKNSKELTTLEVGDVVMFGDLKCTVRQDKGYYLDVHKYRNDKIFSFLNIPKKEFIEELGINTLPIDWIFPEVRSLEALTAIVSALFKEYEKQNEPPKTWEEFCKRYPLKATETFINPASKLITVGEYIDRTHRIPDTDRNVCTSEQEAEAFLALMQLRQLRKAYIKDWEPDWTNPRIARFSITCIEGELMIFDTVTVHRSMSFPNSKLAKEFLTNFKDLLEIAKPLL